MLYIRGSTQAYRLFFTLNCSDRKTQHTRTKTNVHAVTEIRTHDPSIQETKTQALDSSATPPGPSVLYKLYG
jgi:hypothetical protein